MTHLNQFQNCGEILRQMLDLWVAISGVSPDATTVSINMSGKFSSYHIKKMHDELREISAEDDGLTAVFMLKAFFQEFCEQTSVSLWDLLHSRQEKEPWFENASKLDALLRSDFVLDLEKDFIERMRKAATHYGFDINEDLNKLAFVRRDAILCAKKFV